MLYLLLSLAQQFQRLHTEIAFINEENKDLRTHTARLQEEIGRAESTGWDKTGRGKILDRQVQASMEFGGSHGSASSTGKETSIGRVVVLRTGWGWDDWVKHPT
jgi:hypothetical protein